MRLRYFYHYMIFIFIVTFNLNIFSQKKTIIRDTIVEEVVYEYDTIYIDNTSLKIDTLRVPKPKPINILLPANGIAPSIIIPKYPLILNQSDSLFGFVTFEVSGYSTIYNFEKTTTINGIAVKQDEKYFPGYSFSIGIIKRKFCFAMNIGYSCYNEVLEYIKPKTWQDTMDNGNQIFYRTIDSIYYSIITNQYRFLQLNTGIGYQIEKRHFYFLPQLLIGIGFNISQKNFYYDDNAEKIIEIQLKNKATNYAVIGTDCQIGYILKYSVNLFVKPYWQHFFINTSLHPLKYRDIFGVSLGITYSFHFH